MDGVEAVEASAGAFDGVGELERQRLLARLHGLPQIVLDDAEFRDLRGDPLGSRI
jgi:hypothetical protein